MSITEDIARIALRKVASDTFEECAKLASEFASELRKKGCGEAAEPCESLARMYRHLARGKGAR